MAAPRLLYALGVRRAERGTAAPEAPPASPNHGRLFSIGTGETCQQKPSVSDVGGGRGLSGIKAVWGLGMVLALAGCGGVVNPRTDPPAIERSTSKQPDDYLIGSGDSLSVFVYRNPDLSEAAVAVRPDGRISTPLIGDIFAAGKAPTQLAHEIEQRLAKYILEPNVTVIVRSFIGAPDRQVRVIGEATEPIAIPYRDHMTLLDVMIATHGMTKYAAGNRASVVRTDEDGKRYTIKVRLSDLIKDGDFAQNVEMHPGDTLIIPQAWF
jgi:polysaccharide biosynthesis/export protein